MSVKLPHGFEDDVSSIKIDDPINPAHYKSGDARCSKCGHPIECIDVVEHMDFSLGNTVKYLWRSGRKASAPMIQDLEKGAWYLARKIASLKGQK